MLFRAEGLIGLEWEIALLAGMAVLFLGLARGTLRMLERKAKEEGRLDATAVMDAQAPAAIGHSAGSTCKAPPARPLPRPANNPSTPLT